MRAARMTDSDADSLDLGKLRRRDPAEFARLVRAVQPILLGVCQARGLRGADVDDAAADALAAVYRALPAFRGDSRLSTWVYRIAFRSALKARRKYAPSDPAPPDAAPPSTPPSDPAAVAERNEAYARLREAVAGLEPRQAAAVELYYNRGWGVAEVAEALDCPANTVKTLLSRARDALRKALRAEEVRP